MGVGAASVRLVDGSAFTATTLAPMVSVRSGGTSLFAQATFSRVSAAGWSSQGGLQLTQASALMAERWMLEGEGRFAGSTFPGGASTAQGLASLRLYRIGARGTLWAAAGAGSLYDGATWRGLRQGEVGAATDVGWWRLAVSALPTVADDTIRYLDGLATVSTAVRAVDLAFSFGLRAGRALPAIGGDRRAWGGGTVNVWLHPRAALQVGAGAYPVDVTQGFPAGEYLTLALQLGERRRSRPVLQAAARRAAAVSRRAGIVRASLGTEGDSALLVRVYAPTASRVELQSDATQWDAVPMRSVGWGWFELRLARAGRASLELAVRVDGGPWRPPPGTEPITDEFGGVSGRWLLP